jgi:hypothetical protein
VSEVTDDWTLIPDDELRRDHIAHLDDEGLRYYLPALMLWLLDHYNDRMTGSGTEALMTAVGTIMALAPESRFEERSWRIYEGFSAEQREAIARYLEALPRLVDLWDKDAAVVATSMDHYWAQFLPQH